MTSFTFNYLRKGSVTKYSYIGGLGLQHMDLGEHNSIHNIPLFFSSTAALYLAGILYV